MYIFVTILFNMKRMIAYLFIGIFMLIGITPYSQGAIDRSDGDGISDIFERELAEKFAPVLHKTSGDLQVDLADFKDTWENGSIMTGWNLPNGNRIHQPSTPADVNINGLYDSFGKGSSKAYWRVNIDDNIRYQGASIGSRPLYFHVYKDGGVFYVQYWYFFTMNDIRSQTNNDTWHEGDWEHVSLRIDCKNTFDIKKCEPDAVNFYQHYGGHTVSPAEAWWSDDTAVVLAKGYGHYITPCPPRTLCKPRVFNLTHLHIWIARNSHASFNRYDDIYILDSPGIFGFGKEHFEDDIGYDRTDLLFEYDKLVNMGEVYHSQSIDDECDWAHGYCWFEHFKHKNAEDSPSLKGLAFIGDFGAYWVSQLNSPPPGCRDIATASPRSPFFPDMYHEWKSFTDTISGFGNDPVFCLGIGFASITWKVVDMDNDDVPDKTEPHQCLDTPVDEQVDANGCGPSQKDTDGDGVNDKLDICPHTAINEVADASGCGPSQKDTDGDGVNDKLDKCQDTLISEVADVDTDGCGLSQRDSDDDGVNDKDDLFPFDPSRWTHDTTPMLELLLLGPIDFEGDLNNDGCVDRGDLSEIIKIIRGSIILDPSINYDLNGDKIVNIADARFLVTLFTNPRGVSCN